MHAEEEDAEEVDEATSNASGEGWQKPFVFCKWCTVDKVVCLVNPSVSEQCLSCAQEGNDDCKKLVVDKSGEGQGETGWWPSGWVFQKFDLLEDANQNCEGEDKKAD